MIDVRDQFWSKILLFSVSLFPDRNSKSKMHFLRLAFIVFLFGWALSGLTHGAPIVGEKPKKNQEVVKNDLEKEQIGRNWKRFNYGCWEANYDANDLDCLWNAKYVE